MSQRGGVCEWLCGAYLPDRLSHNSPPAKGVHALVEASPEEGHKDD